MNFQISTNKKILQEPSHPLLEINIKVVAIFWVKMPSIIICIPHNTWIFTIQWRVLIKDQKLMMNALKSLLRYKSLLIMWSITTQIWTRDDLLLLISKTYHWIRWMKVNSARRISSVNPARVLSPSASMDLQKVGNQLLISTIQTPNIHPSSSTTPLQFRFQPEVEEHFSSNLNQC